VKPKAELELGTALTARAEGGPGSLEEEGVELEAGAVVRPRAKMEL